MRDRPQHIFDLQKALGRELAYSHTGSRAICNPAPTDTDDDWILLVNRDEMLDVFHILAEDWGFKADLSEHYKVAFEGGFDEFQFVSYKLKNLNLLITCSERFFVLHKLATNVCRDMNLLKKDDRIRVFQAVLYGNHWTPASAKIGGAV